MTGRRGGGGREMECPYRKVEECCPDSKSHHQLNTESRPDTHDYADHYRCMSFPVISSYVVTLDTSLYVV